ncbi:MAG: hypothetical protein VKJ06_04455 [Vampirovibrionales bacterium]|nr:hypothetical protein [Vampirovibrionales bacterium]
MSATLNALNPLSALQNAVKTAAAMPKGLIPPLTKHTATYKAIPKAPWSVSRVLPHLLNPNYEHTFGAGVLNGLNHAMSPKLNGGSISLQQSVFYHLAHGSQKAAYAGMLAAVGSAAVFFMHAAAPAALPAWLAASLATASGSSAICKSLMFPAVWVGKRAGFDVIAATRAAHRIVEQQHYKLAQKSLTAVA